MDYIMKRFLDELPAVNVTFKFPIQKISMDGRRYAIRLQQITTPDDFYLTLVDYPNDEYKQLTGELNRVYRTLIDGKKIRRLDSVNVGDHVIFQAGMNFGRGEVYATRERSGNSVDVVDLDLGEIFESRTMAMLFPVVNNSLIRESPMLSFHCKIHGIAPPTTAGWTEDIVNQFTENYTQRGLNCAFTEVDDDGVYSISLLMKDNREVADHMLSNGLARRPRQVLPPRCGYPTLDSFAPGDIVSVIVSHVESSARFSVQWERNEDIISKLSREIQLEYLKNGDQYKTVSPIRGQVCVAQYAYDRQWYRGIITARPSPSRVEVLFVDYGNKDRVMNNAVKALKPEFAKHAAQAIPCILANVTDNDFKTDKLAILISNKRLKMLIESYNEEDEVYVVTLYQDWEKKRYVINDYMRGRAPAPPNLPSLKDYPDTKFDV